MVISSSTLTADAKTKWFPEFEKTLPSLEGKTICVTGCTSGTGYIVARTAIRKGASKVLLLNRPSDRATKAEESLKTESSFPETIETVPCDLQDFDSVRSAIDSIKAKCDSIDVLCNNAGVMALEDVATKDGYDVQMQTNHLSHFLLTKELFPLLRKAAEIHGDARVCNHSSEARRRDKALDAQYFGKNGGNLGGNGNNILCGGARWVRYSQTKLANSVFSSCLADRFQKYQGLKSVCAHPGLASTQLAINTEKDGGLGSGMHLILLLAQSTEDGSMPIVAACFDPSTENGSFWAPSKFGGFRGPAKKITFDKASTDESNKSMLWELSEEACGLFDIKK